MDLFLQKPYCFSEIPRSPLIPAEACRLVFVSLKHLLETVIETHQVILYEYPFLSFVFRNQHHSSRFPPHWKHPCIQEIIHYLKYEVRCSLHRRFIYLRRNPVRLRRFPRPNSPANALQLFHTKWCCLNSYYSRSLPPETGNV